METLYILHGWQSSKEKWQKVADFLKGENLNVKVLDIPGFKPKTRLKKEWNLDNFVDWFSKQTKEEKDFYLLGHSFGGRIAIKFASQNPERLKGLILVSAAGIKRVQFYKKFLSSASFLARKAKIPEAPVVSNVWRFGRKVFYRLFLRRRDYIKAEGFLKETIKNILSEDLTEFLPIIKTKTLIIWGKKDKFIPLKDGKLMEGKIKNSRLDILDGVGHIPHIKAPNILAQKIKEFIL